MEKNISRLEKLLRYSFTPIFLLELLPISGGIYLASKVAKAKGWLSPDEKIRYIDILREVYKGRKELYFPKESLFSSEDRKINEYEVKK